MQDEPQPSQPQQPAVPPTMPSIPAHPPSMPPAIVDPPQDPYATTADDRTMGMLVHLLALLTGFLGPLILWLVKKDESRFVDHHGKEAVNFQISLFIYVVCLMALSFAVAFMTMGLGMFLIMPLIFVVSIGALVLELLACLAANRGEWHRYPMTIRFIS